MMPPIASSIPVAGTTVATPSGFQLVLSEKLISVDTFLSGTLEIADDSVRVRILTLDDVTVLQPVDDLRIEPGDWVGALNVSHGLRPQTVPVDLHKAARKAGRDVYALNESDLRYALTFLGEATTPRIRDERIAAVTAALPLLPRRLISFDVGGTLGNATGVGITSALLEASPRPAGEARRVVRELLHTVAEVTDHRVRELSAGLRVAPEVVRVALDARTTFVPHPDAADLLASLAGLGTVVTLSNASRSDSPIEEMQNHFGRWIDDFFPSWRTGRSKPDTRAFDAVAELCGFEASQMVHVGDDWDSDVVGAVEAGARAIWVSRGRITPDPALAESGRVQIVRDLGQVASAITNESRRSTS